MVEKKKIFFLLFSMNLGGVEKSFLNLIADKQFEDVEVHLGLLKKEGEFMTKLPSNIIIHECCKGLWKDLNMPIHRLVIENIKIHNYLKAIQLTLDYFKYKINGTSLSFHQTLLKGESEIDIEFDEAYAYAGPASIIDYYVVKKIKAKKKYGWIHFDISKIWIDLNLIKNLYPFYEKIFVVSKEAKIKFDSKFPEFINKTEVRYNIVNKEEINYLALIGETFNDNFQGIRILTVGRLSKEKGQDLAIKVLKSLIEKGFNVKWYFVGIGPLEEEYKRLAKELEVEDNIEFLGKKLNPYTYMKDCDLYVQPSIHEGYCITLAEARCFDIPIIATNFAGASEQLCKHIKKDLSLADPTSLTNSIIRIYNES